MVLLRLDWDEMQKAIEKAGAAKKELWYMDPRYGTLLIHVDREGWVYQLLRDAVGVYHWEDMNNPLDQQRPKPKHVIEKSKRIANTKTREAILRRLHSVKNKPYHTKGDKPMQRVRRDCFRDGAGHQDNPGACEFRVHNKTYFEGIFIANHYSCLAKHSLKDVLFLLIFFCRTPYVGNLIMKILTL